MKTLSICFVVAFCLISSLGIAQVSPDLVGLYSAKAKAVNYETVPPEKFTATVVVQILPDSSAIVLVTTDPDPVLIAGTPGTVQQRGNNLFFRFASSPSLVLGGRLTFKGKPGKQSLKGTLALDAGELANVVEYKVKLKRVSE